MTSPAPEKIDALLAEYLHLEGPLMPILHAMQDAFGHIPEAAHRPIAEALRISQAGLRGVISF
ncbi:NADH:ubiquinone oxidoreductase subunit E [Roseovarius sp. MBR-79]